VSEAKRILIIDDDPDITEAMRLVLQNQGYEVSSADTAEEGMEHCRTERPDLVILDVMMPEGTEGLHFAWNIRKDSDPAVASTPILMVTAIHQSTRLRVYPDQKDGTYGPGEFLPVDGFLDKPVEPEVLVQKVKELIRDNG